MCADTADLEGFSVLIHDMIARNGKCPMQFKRCFAGFFFPCNFRRLFGSFFGNFFGFHFALRLCFGGLFHFFGEFLGCCNHFGNRRCCIFVFLPLRNNENNHNKSLLAAVLRINKDIDIPDFPRDADGNVLDSAFQYKFYKKHFFDNVDFQDARLLRTEFFQKKIDRYFEKMILQAPDTIIKESKMLLDKAEGCDEVFRFLLQTIFNKYNNSDIMGMDKVLVFFGDNYYLNGRATWADSTWLEKLRERVEELRYNQVGNQAVELKLYTYDDQPVTISGVNAEYTVLFFFEPSCGHCKKATPKMKALADKFWERGVEVMGIYTQTDKEEWGKFIESQGLENWINAWDPYNQSGFRLFYDIRSTPSIYLLDRGKKIIAKRIDVETLEKVLEDEYARKDKKK